MGRFNKAYIKKLFMPDGKDKSQLDKMSQVTATASELNIMGGVTATAAELNRLDTSVNGALMTAGAGVTAGVGTIVKYGISRAGDIITTQILIDITGLQSGAGAGDIFGDPVGTGAKSHFGQITTAVNGVIWGGHVKCMETPAGCNVDIDFADATVDTGVQDANGTALTGYHQLLNGGAQAGNSIDQPLTAYPDANSYLYLLAGSATNTVASAGRFLITLYGYVA